MKKRYKLIFSNHYIRKVKRLLKNRDQLEAKLNTVLFKLAYDPFSRELKTHKVDARIGIEHYSSRIDGDIRIIWNFSGDRIYIILLDIGGHSGSKGVYK